MTQIFGAIDLGASSGRVIAAEVGPDDITLTEIHRFPNSALQFGNGLYWDFDGLFASIEEGLAALGKFASERDSRVISLGIDSWAVDYGLVGADGQVISQPRCYRDERNQIGVKTVHEQYSSEELYSVNGLQFQPFNTIYQLAAEREADPELWERVDKILLIPDLIAFLLTGKSATERTNGSTTGLMNAATRDFDLDLLSKLQLDRDKFATLLPEGSILGQLQSPEKFGDAFATTVVTLVGSHDTASAVAGVPSLGSDCAYLSSGTWSLLGVELDQPIFSEASRGSNFTNELGVDGKIRFLKNLSGLWLLSECLRTWETHGTPQDLQSLLEAAALLPETTIIDVNDSSFVSPGDMPARIAKYCLENSLVQPSNCTEFVRCIMDSLARSYADTIRELQEITGKTLSRINIVGGGSQNSLLCQLTANATGMLVEAGPVEATALGNILVQARSHGVLRGSLEDLRRVIRRSSTLQSYFPA